MMKEYQQSDIEEKAIKILLDNSALQEEKEKAFRIFVDIYKNNLLEFVYNYIKPKGSPQDAEEIVLDVFIKFYKNINSFKQKSSPKTYLFRIAVNLSINFLKSQKKNVISLEEKNIEDNPLTQKSDNLEDIIIKKEEENKFKSILEESLETLSKKQKLAFHLAIYQKMSYKEIAKILKTSISSVESLLFRARQNIKKYIIKKLKEHD
ncbi:MAG: sigma-70 family RNA polymerase sigma factor [Endomicrobiia bacterium]